MIILAIVVGIYAGAIILLNIPYIQHKVASVVASELHQKLQTNLSIGKVDVGFFNRIIIEDVNIDDQSGQPMLKAARLAAKVEILPLFEKTVNIRSIQLFGFDIHLYKKNPKAPLNCQFVIDAFKSKHPSTKPTPLNMRINALLIRRGAVSYDILSKPYHSEHFDVNHLHLSELSATVNLKHLTDDSLRAVVRRMDFREQSGLVVKHFSMQADVNPRYTMIRGLDIKLPDSHIKFDDIYAGYDSYVNLKQFVDKVNITTNIKASVRFTDIACFVPQFKHTDYKVHFSTYLHGTINNLRLSRIELHDNVHHFNFLGDIHVSQLAHIRNLYLSGIIRQLSIKSEGLAFLAQSLHVKGINPKIFNQISQFSYIGHIRGSVNDITMLGGFRTGVGNVLASVRYVNNPATKVKRVMGSIKATRLNLGAILNNTAKFGYTDFDMKVDATFAPHTTPSVIAKGLIAHLSYNRYDYKNIKVDGIYSRTGFDGKISMDDANGQISINGKLDLHSKSKPQFNLTATLKDFSPNKLQLTPKMQGMSISGSIRANFSGRSIDDAVGEIHIDTVHMRMSNGVYDMPALIVVADHRNGSKHLSLSSNDVDAEVHGNYSYQTLTTSVINIIKRYIPSLFTDRKMSVSNNNFQFKLSLKNTEFINKVLNIPLSLKRPASFYGYFNDKDRKIKVSGEFPYVSYNGFILHQGRLFCDSPEDAITCRLSGITQMKNGSSLNLSLDLKASNDQLATAFNWGNNTAMTYSGQIASVTTFAKSTKNIKANVRFDQSDIILGDSIWRMYPSTMKVDSGCVYINNILIKHRDQYIKILGKASKSNVDSIKVNLNKVDLAYIFDVVNFKSVDFGGITTGEISVSGALKNPELNSHLFVKDFKMNGGFLGDAQIFGNWDNVQKGISINANIGEKNLSNAHVHGYVWLGRKELSLNVDASNTRTKFIESYVKSVASDIDGRATGHFHVYGTFHLLNVTGTGKVDAKFKINVLNTYFALHDSVYLTENEIKLNNAKVGDLEGHTGHVTCAVYHRNFKNWNYKIDVQANDIVVYNNDESSDMSFYGKLYATGNATLTGNTSSLNINGAFRPSNKTVFVYRMSQSSSVVGNQFIHFIDKTPTRPVYDSLFVQPNVDKSSDDSRMDVHMTLAIDANPNATVKVIVDQHAGDNVTCTGSGNLRVEYYNKGDMRTFGTYTVDQGTYKFSLQGVIHKNFSLVQGSSITFNGNTDDAALSVQALYTVNNVSLSDLVGQSMAGSLQSANSSIKVNCLLNVTGALQQPDVKFGIALPNEDEEVQRIVRNYIATDDQMNMQMLYLLSVGKFYTPEYTQLSSSSTQQTNSVMTSVLSSTLSGQLSNLLSQMINVQNWNFGVNGSTGDNGWNNLDLEGMLSGRLLNNRLLINGNFGYRNNAYNTNQTDFIGDFDFQWLLTKNGNIRLKAYNKANDRYPTKTSLNTQGIGILFKKDFNSWLDFSPWYKKKEDE